MNPQPLFRVWLILIGLLFVPMLCVGCNRTPGRTLTSAYSWDDFTAKIKQYPAKSHRLHPPCTPEQIQQAERAVGKFPILVKEQLVRFNGAELFVQASTTFTLFGITESPTSVGWDIVSFTKGWRARNPSRQQDWVLGISNYGGVAILTPAGLIDEWDTSEKRWLIRNVPVDEWIASVFKAGDVVLAETQSASPASNE